MSPAARAAGLPASVLVALQRAKVPASAMSVVVERVGDPEPLIAWNASRPMMPASTMKLVTTFSGLSILGPDYRWRTTAYTDGTIDPDGTLQGNLYIKGTGDPKLVPEELIDLVDKLRKAGVKRVAGGLVLDKSYFATSTRDLPSFDDDASAPYNVGPDPLLYAFKAVSFTVTPGDDGKVAVDVLPPLADLSIDNQLVEGTGPCSAAAAAARPTLTAGGGIMTASFAGDYPLRCGAHTTNLAILDHTTFFARGFLALWQQDGGTIARRERGQGADRRAAPRRASQPGARQHRLRHQQVQQQRDGAQPVPDDRRGQRQAARDAGAVEPRDPGVPAEERHRDARPRARERLGPVARRTCERAVARRAAAGRERGRSRRRSSIRC